MYTVYSLDWLLENSLGTGSILELEDYELENSWDNQINLLENDNDN